MKRVDYNKKIRELKTKIVNNSTDKDLAKELVSNLISAKGQSMVEPTLINIPLSSVVKEQDGGTYHVSICENGDAVYHLKCGYEIVCTPNCKGLNQTLRSIIEDTESLDQMPYDKQEIVKVDMNATAHVLSIPLIAFQDDKLKYELANLIVKYLLEYQEKADDAELQPEDAEKDNEFKEVALAAETIKESFKD